MDFFIRAGPEQVDGFGIEFHLHLADNVQDRKTVTETFDHRERRFGTVKQYRPDFRVLFVCVYQNYIILHKSRSDSV